MTFLYLIIFSLLGSVGGVLGAFLFIALGEKFQKSIVRVLLPFATGALLASALLGLIPQSLESIPVQNVFIGFLLGILLFFTLEKIIIWRHCHHQDCEEHSAKSMLILLGDGFHNFIDGVAIGASFLVSIPFGIAASVSIIAHELPQELGDFGILLHSGMEKRKALLLNTLSGLATVPGAILGFIFLDRAQEILPFILVIAGASFVYIALADLSPELHKKIGPKSTVRQVFLMTLGALIVGLLLRWHVD